MCFCVHITHLPMHSSHCVWICIVIQCGLFTNDYIPNGDLVTNKLFQICCFRMCAPFPAQARQHPKTFDMNAWLRRPRCYQEAVTRSCRCRLSAWLTPNSLVHTPNRSAGAKSCCSASCGVTETIVWYIRSLGRLVYALLFIWGPGILTPTGSAATSGFTFRVCTAWYVNEECGV